MILAWVVILLGCDLLGDAEETGLVCDREPPLSYDSWGHGFMEKHCTACHSSLLSADERNNAPEGVDFETYAGVLQYADRIEARTAVAEPTMPPGGGPTEEEIGMLYEWLQCGVYPDKDALAGDAE